MTTASLEALLRNVLQHRQLPFTFHSVSAAVQAWVHENMSDYAVPRFVRVVDTILRNRTGKVDKIGLRSELVADLEASGRRGAP